MKPSDITTRFATCITALLASSGVFGAGQVSSILLTEQSATPFTYSANGIEYQWGRGNNLSIDGFVTQSRNFSYAVSADEVVVRRDDIAGVTSGQPCGIFVERLSMDDSTRTFAADYPADDSESGNCSLESLLDSRAINRGVVDVFSNTLPDAKNIERLDYLFFFGTLAPIDENQLRLAGHVVAEKRGNNAVKMASILALDAFGQPAEYGPLVLISPVGCSDPQICYGSTDLTQTYSFLQNEFNAPQGLPVETEQSRETVAMAFVSTADLGLNPGQRYFGVSLFADDVDEQVHDLLDPSTFPNDTSDDDIVLGDDADIYGGVAGYYLADELSVVGGRLFLDVNMNGMSDADEAAISDVSVTLFSDVNGNGMLDIGTDVQLGDTTTSNIDGDFQFPGVTDGNILVVLDESDPQIPDGLVVAPGINPQPLTVAGGTSDPVSFSFVSESGTGSGSGNDDTDGGVMGDGSDGSATGDGTDGGTGDGADGGTGDGADGGTGDGTDGGTGDGTDGGTGDGTDGGTGDGTDGGTGDGTDGGTGDGTEGGTGDGTDGGTGDGTDGGTDGGTGDGTDGGTGGRTGQMVVLATGQMVVLATGQMVVLATGQMVVLATGQMVVLATGQMVVLATGQTVVPVTGQTVVPVTGQETARMVDRATAHWATAQMVGRVTAQATARMMER